jgi:hypothetical protein
MSIKELSERPPKVVLAIKLLYLVVGIGMIRAVMTVLRHADVRSPYFFILTKLFIYTGSLFLIYQLGKCKNWAKVSLVVILAVSIPLTILPAFESISHNPIHTLLGFMQIILYVVALVFLFHNNSSNWFAAGRVSNTAKKD